MWKKDSERRLGEEKKSKLTKDDWKMREVTGEEPKVKSLAKAYEGLKKEVEAQKKAERDFAEYKKQADKEMDDYRRDMEKRISDLQQALKEASAASPSTALPENFTTPVPNPNAKPNRNPNPNPKPGL